MKNTLLLSAFTLLILGACGPAAEDRAKMDENARIMSDTIKANIEQSLDNVIKEVSVPSGVVFVAPGTATNATTATVNSATAQPKK